MGQKSNLQDNEFYQKGLQAFKKNNYGYAIELFRIVLESYPEFTQCRHYLLRAAREDQKLKNVSFINIFLIKINILLLNIKVVYFYLQNKFNLVIKLQENLVLLTPGNTSVLYKLAVFFYKTNKLNSAIVVLEEIIFIDKKNLAALKLLARLYFQNKNYAKAKTIATILLDLSPRNFEAENIIKDISALGTIEKGFDEIKPAT
ncbi:MAG: tetratricopeptide repeat protein [Candidatus Omnitrophota bacterium]